MAGVTACMPYIMISAVVYKKENLFLLTYKINHVSFDLFVLWGKFNVINYNYVYLLIQNR